MVTYLINGKKETFENEADAQAYIKALGPGNDVELLTEGPSSDDKKTDDWETDGFATGEDENKVFPTDAAEGADVVSETPAQDTESASEDGSSDSQTEFQGGQLDQVVLSNFKDKEKPGRELVNADVWEETFSGYGDTAVRALETQFKGLDEYTVESDNRGGKYDNPEFSTIVTHTDPDTQEQTTFELQTLAERGGTTKKSKGKGKEFADFVANTMSPQDAATLRVKGKNFQDSPIVQSLQATKEEAEASIGSLEDVFAPTTELVKTGKGQTMELVVQPYEKEIKENTEKYLRTHTPMSYEGAETQVKANMYSKMLADERLNLITKKREEFLSENPEFRDEFTVFGNLKNSKLVTEYQDNTLLAKSLSNDLGNMSRSHDQLDSFKKDPSKPVVIDGVQWGGNEGEIIGTWNKIPITQANYDQLTSMQTNYNATYKTYSDTVAKNASIADKMPEAFAMSKANSLNYSLAEKAFSTFGWGIADIVTGTGYAVTALGTGVGSIIGGAAAAATMGEDAPSVDDIYDTSMKSVDAIANKYSQAKDASKRGYVRDVSVDDGFSSPKNFGKFVLQEASTQGPIVVAMMATGGYGALTVGMYTGGQAGMEMAFEDALMGKETKRVNQFLTMAGIGLANALPTQLTTVPILRKAKKQFFESTKFGTEGAKQYALGTKDFIKSQYKDIVNDVLLENVGEITTNFAENAIYGNDPYENIKHVAISSTGFSFVFSALPFFKGVAARSMAAKADIEQLSSYADAALQAEKSLKNHRAAMEGLEGDLLINARKTDQILFQVYVDANKASNEKATELLEKPLNGVTKDGSETFAQLQTDAAKLKREIAILSNSTNADQSVIDQKIEKFANLKAAQELYIGSGYRNEFVLMQATKPDVYNKYISDARTKLERENPGKIYSSKDNQVELAATREYNIDQSRKRAKQNKKINPNLQVFETRDEAMDYIDEREDLSESTKEKVITSIETGSAGASVKTQDGGTLPYVIIEAEADNNKQFVQEHELGHGNMELIFKGKDRSKLLEIGNQVREWLKINNPSLSARMETAMQGYEKSASYDKTDVAEEALMEFFEMVNENRIDLTSSKNVPLNGMMAAMIQDAVGTDVYDYNFRGVDDFAAFAVKLAKGIRNGDIDIARLKETISKVKTTEKSSKKKAEVKESMSPKMRKLFDRKEATEDNPYLDPEERDNKLQGINQQINELKDIEAAQNKSIGNKAKPSGPMTLEEADAAYEDALDAWEDAPDNDALLEEVEKALKEVEAAKNRFDAGEEATPEVTPEDKPTEKKVREKKERSKKKYSLTDDAKAKIEPLIEEAQSMNKELSAREKETDATKIAKIEAKPESEMTRTEKALAIKKIKDNPTRTTKPAKLQRIETEILDRLEKPIGKAITFFTKLLYDKIPKEAAAVIGGRDAYKSAAQARITSMVINEFKKTTINRKGEETINDVEDLIFNRGGLRLLTLATDLGVASASEGISQQFDNVSNNIGTEDTMFDEGGLQMSVEGKFKISSLLASGARYKQAMDAAVEFWKTNKGNSPVESFSKLPGFTAEVLAEMFDIPVGIFDKRISRSPNLNKETYKKAMDAITKPYAVFKLTKDGITIEERTEIDTAEAFTKEMQSKGFEVERVADQNMLQTLFKFLPQLSAEDYKYLIDGSKGRSKGKSTGVPNNVVKLAFDKIQRNTTGVGNKSGNLRRLTYKEVLDGIGGFVDTDGKAKMKMGITGRSPEGQTFIGVMRTLNRMVSNELSRSAAVGLDPMTIKDIAAGKNVLMESKKLDLSKITIITPELGVAFDAWFKGKKDPSSVKQLEMVSKLAGKILGGKGRKIFNAELAYNFDKLGADATLEDVRNKLGDAWGKVYKWLYRDQGFQKAVGNLNESSTKEDVRQFLQAFSRAWRNDSYQKVSTNEQMVNLLKDQGVDFEGLGFELEKRGNKGYIYEVIDGKRDFVNNPTTILEIKNKAFDRIQAYGLDSINEVQKLQKVVLDVIDTALTVDDAIAAIEAMSIGQMATLRRISYLRNVYKSDGPTVLEHVTSLAIIKETLKEYARGNVENIQEFLDGLYLDVIPKEIDDLLAKVGTEARYTPKIKALLEKYKLKSFDVVGERNSLKESKRAENAQLATDLAITRKSDAKRKGISVLDFDDTLARTASQVLYTLPNGKKGKLTAEQFAKDGDRMTKEGVEWDFSEFSKVVDGKKGPLFEKTKNLVSKFGNENVFILTARPANSKYAIHEFLSGLGLDIPLQNITGLADSNPQAKGDWITSKAAEGYNDFFFADDHIKNVMAVKEALNIDGVKSKVEQALVKESKKLKRQYSAIIAKRRGGGTITDAEVNSGYIEKQIDTAFFYMGNAVQQEQIGATDLTKAKKMALHFLANSHIRFPEDGYKIVDALHVAAQNKIDPFTFKNVDELLASYDLVPKAKRVNPDEVKEFSNKTDVPNSDISIYDVDFTKAGQKAVRNAVDTNWGKKSNPWCVVAWNEDPAADQNAAFDEYYKNRRPLNVVESIEFNQQVVGGKTYKQYDSQARSMNIDSDLSQEEMAELVEGGERPGFILIQNFEYTDVDEDTGEELPSLNQVWYKLKDPTQTKEQFYDSGAIHWPPMPDVGPIPKVLNNELWQMYGKPNPAPSFRIGNREIKGDRGGSPGGWKIAFKGGKLLSLRNEGSNEQNWWDRMDRPTIDLAIESTGNSFTTINTKTGKTTFHKAKVVKESKKLDRAINGIVDAETIIDKTPKSKGQPKYVKDLLDVFDMDGEGQTLLDKATRQLDLQWNMLYEGVTGVDSDVFSFNEVEAQKLGDEVSKGFKARFKSIMRGYLVESGADDFLGLLYRTLPKGKEGEAMMKLYEENLLKPFAIASREVEKARIKMAKRYRDIKVNNQISDKVLNGKVTLKTESGKDITYTSEDAVRVYMWRTQAIKVPGLSEENELDLAQHVKDSDELYRFALNLMNKTSKEEFADPSKNWVTGSLKTDYLEGINKAKRKEALRFWSKGIETIFSEDNVNKLRVQHGTKYVAALQNSIERMKTGRNSSQSLDSDTKVMLQFISGAVGNIMFLNTRSAGLQLLSATNFMAAGDNTWGKSLKTMLTKMPTLAKDYKMLMNTDFLLDRRNALKMDVNDSDIARIAEGKGFQGKLARFLQWGYVFTQAADSRAIALGGAVYYRNAYDKLIKQGVDPKAAKEQALLETTEHAQNSQQSSRADKISKQQASTAGRLMLAFANTPMQYNRLVQKAYLDLANGRGSKGKNLYNIAYYGLAQNLLFTVAQGAMVSSVWGTLFGDDEEEDKLDYNDGVGMANGVLSSWLRGMGLWGNAINALKQTIMNVHAETKKKRPEYDVAAIKGLTSIIPAVGSKFSKIYTTTRAIDYNKDFLFDVNEGNVFKNYAKMPGTIILGQTAAFLNIPLDRAQKKTANLIDAVNYAQSDLTKTGGLLFGHALWTLQSDAEKEADYEEQQARRKGMKKEKKEEEKKKELTPGEIRRYDLKKLKKQEQIDMLNELGLFTKEIRKLKKEADRIEAIIKYQNLKKRKDSLK
jgi:hypothetical protein